MKINSLNFNTYPKYQSFKATERKNQPYFDNKTFKVSMGNYDYNYYNLLKMNQLALDISDLIQEDGDFDKILHNIEDGVRKINYNDWHFGTIRTSKRPFPMYQGGLGNEYLSKYVKRLDNGYIRPQSSEKYKNANTSEISYKPYPTKHLEIDYGWTGEDSNLELVKKEYEDLKSIENPTLDEINQACATIQWLILQENPYMRGNDSIANILTKAIYNSYGIKVSPPRIGHSFDFEGFYRDLDEYIEIYPNIFRIPPYKY